MFRWLLLLACSPIETASPRRNTKVVNCTEHSGKTYTGWGRKWQQCVSGRLASESRRRVTTEFESSEVGR